MRRVLVEREGDEPNVRKPTGQPLPVAIRQSEIEGDDSAAAGVTLDAAQQLLERPRVPVIRGGDDRRVLNGILQRLRYSTEQSMTNRPPIRIAFSREAPTGVPWQQRAIDEATAVDGVTLAASPRDADVVIDFRYADVDARPPLGVWRFAFGDGAPAANGAKGTIARLYRLTTDPDRAVVLHEGWYRGRTAEGWGTPDVPFRVAPWCARALRQILLGDADVLSRPAVAIAGCRDPEPPSQRDSLGLRLADATRDWFTRQRWTVGLVPMRLDEVLQRGRLPEPAWLRNQPSDRFFADPFVVAVEGDRVELLVEEYRYSARQKGIVALDVTRSGSIERTRPQPGLPPASSYPFLMRQHDALVCVPETFRAARASAFVRDARGTWTHDADVLTSFPAVDSTIVHRDGSWWLFCTKQGDEDQTDLHLFFADDWRGPWRPHPLNPVKSDTRSSRPAGACFESAGALYRPAQNCARRYGAGITINKVIAMTKTNYVEEPVWSHEASEDSTWPNGMHTINGCADITVVDGLRLERRLGPASWSGRH